jgi:hypothetical protein
LLACCIDVRNPFTQRVIIPGEEEVEKKKREGQQHKNGEEYIAKEGNLLQVFAAAAESQLALTEEYYIHPVERIKNHKGIAQVCG